ncbi:MAG: thiamine phosphate synthase [Myxococcota bacterium]
MPLRIARRRTVIVGITAGGADLLPRVRDALGAGIDRVLVREAEVPAGIEAVARDWPGRVVLHARMPGAIALATVLPLGLHYASTTSPADWRGVFSVSTHAPDEARRAMAAGAAWVFLSPVWAPGSKPDDTRRPLAEGPLGLAVLGVVPGCVALGGVTVERVAACRAAGARGVAGIGGLFGAPDVGAAVGAWRAAWGV